MKRTALLIGIALALGCGGSTTTILNLKPTITSMTQSMASAGGGPFVLGVRGTNFAPGAKVTFNGRPCDTTTLDPGEIQATIVAQDIATAGTYPVTVRNPDGKESEPVNFIVN
jgi:hypothetical protein